MKKTKFLLLALLGCLLVAPVFAAQAKDIYLELVDGDEGFYTYDAAQNNNIVLTPDDLENGLYFKFLGDYPYIHIEFYAPHWGTYYGFTKEFISNDIYKITNNNITQNIDEFDLYIAGCDESSCLEVYRGAFIDNNFLTTDLSYFIPPTPTPPTPTPIVPFTNDISAQLVSYPSILFNDLFLLLVLIIGLPLGFWLITKLISLLKKNFK